MSIFFPQALRSVPLALAASGALFLSLGAAEKDGGGKVEINRSFLPMFQPLPEVMKARDGKISPAQVELGRKLYHDERFSKNHDISCHTCHQLEGYGVDHRQFSEGHRGQLTGRNSPTVYNVALHLAQFWDGRSADVEAQALGPVLSPVEMGMPSGDYVERVIESIDGYVKEFAKAFPEDQDPVTFENFGRAIGAFERTLVTPSRWDQFLKGDEKALTDREKAGFNKFVEVGCLTCHNGPAVGGQIYQKLGLAKSWPELHDVGRFAVTQNENDKYAFKVPGLRNVEKTGPYLHDGSVKELPVMVRMMARHQLGKELKDEEVASIVDFLKALTGDLPDELTRKPELPPSGPKTPAPDPS